MIRDFLWFKENLVPVLKGFELKYRSYEEGDFGKLNQVEFNSQKKGGNIDFWEQGWLGIFLWDYITEEEIMNVLIKPNENEEKEKALERFLKLLD